MGGFLVILGVLCAIAVPVLFIIFIVRAIMKRSKKWIGISAGICGFLVLPLMIAGGLLLPKVEPADDDVSLETKENAVTTAVGGSVATKATTTEPVEITTVATTVPPVTTTTTKATTTAVPPTETTTTTKVTTTVPTTTAPMTTKAPKTTKATTTKPPETTTTEPPVTFEEVYIAYQENELRASEMYEGERIRFSGTVDTIYDSFLGTTSVWIDVYAQGQKHGVLCSFSTKAQKDSLMKLNAGDYVTIEGTCVDWMSWGLCEIVE